MICEVLKPITGPGGITYSPGQKVDVSEWRWAKQLVTQHKLRPVLSHVDSPAETEAAIVMPKRGRPKKTTVEE
jgi:hypothetical protein